MYVYSASLRAQAAKCSDLTNSIDATPQVLIREPQPGTGATPQPSSNQPRSGRLNPVRTSREAGTPTGVNDLTALRQLVHDSGLEPSRSPGPALDCLPVHLAQCESPRCSLNGVAPNLPQERRIARISDDVNGSRASRSHEVQEMSCAANKQSWSGRNWTTPRGRWC